ncbi:cytochrome C [Bacillus sp. B15-48]|uniref:cytochrome C n=1 Tax=Bacillus sp. B15-48 TaxID=1548601 RepID=UPI00193F4116|nr:cytochrome C [Bacillus sp. B15-48]MBM4761612.1 cytochrome C [Bacillus sp. B15-48]
MSNSVAIFIICAILGLGIGFAGFEIVKKNNAQPVSTPTETAVTEQTEDNPETPVAETVSASGEVLNAQGCIACHAVSSLNLEGGATGPDLSQAFTNVEGKHGKPLDEFLKEPTSAVMASVISGNPLSDEEVQQVVDALQEAAEK